MSRDYARTRRSTPRHKSDSAIPGWVWLLTGLVTGAFIMFLVYLAGLVPPTKTAGVQTNTASPASQSSSQQLKKNLEKPIFEFYDTLMNSEVIGTSSSPESETPVDPDQPKPVYMLQVASFKNVADADSLKAQLILEGLDVSLAEFSNLGHVYHRVMVGPFSSASQMTEAKKILATHNLNPIVLQKKPDA
jgi:cell division protein FtsN